MTLGLPRRGRHAGIRHSAELRGAPDAKPPREGVSGARHPHGARHQALQAGQAHRGTPAGEGALQDRQARQQRKPPGALPGRRSRARQFFAPAPLPGRLRLHAEGGHRPPLAGRDRQRRARQRIERDHRDDGAALRPAGPEGGGGEPLLQHLRDRREGPGRDGHPRSPQKPRRGPRRPAGCAGRRHLAGHRGQSQQPHRHRLRPRCLGTVPRRAPCRDGGPPRRGLRGVRRGGGLPVGATTTSTTAFPWWPPAPSPRRTGSPPSGSATRSRRRNWWIT